MVKRTRRFNRLTHWKIGNFNRVSSELNLNLSPHIGHTSICQTMQHRRHPSACKFKFASIIFWVLTPIREVRLKEVFFLTCKKHVLFKYFFLGKNGACVFGIMGNLIYWLSPGIKQAVPSPPYLARKKECYGG